MGANSLTQFHIYIELGESHALNFVPYFQIGVIIFLDTISNYHLQISLQKILVKTFCIEFLFFFFFIVSFTLFFFYQSHIIKQV